MADYLSQLDNKNIYKIKEIVAALPPYVQSYFNARKNDTTTKTRLSYAYDYKNFFNWLKTTRPECSYRRPWEIEASTLNSLTDEDIALYIDYLKKDNEITKSGVTRKISALNSLFTYLYKKKIITSNPVSIADKPKHETQTDNQPLTKDEITDLLHIIQHGSRKFSKVHRKRLKKSRERDFALTIMLLNTGLKLSELVGLNTDDIDLEKCFVRITEKGETQRIVPLSDDTVKALKVYSELREKTETEATAFFLSSQKKRMSLQTVENLLLKYGEAVEPPLHITPQKLRKTFGSELYRKTGDINLVATVLGHDNINTIKYNYIKIDDDTLLEARNTLSYSKKKKTTGR